MLLIHKQLPTVRTQKFKELREQAASHTSLSGMGRLIDEKRPSEIDKIRDFRKRNQRKITLIESQAWYNMIAMIFTNSGMNTLVSDTLRAFLDTSPFLVNFKDLDLNTWFFHSALPNSCQDPNGLFLVYPIKDDYVDTKVGNTPGIKFFSSDQFKGYTNFTLKADNLAEHEVIEGEEFVYFAIEQVVDGITKDNTFEHWLVSKNKIVVLRDDVKGNPVLVWWYQHNFNALPLVSPPSIDTKFEGHTVNISLMSGMFEWWDEALTRFSDAQAIANKADFPTLVMSQIKCTAKGCTNGKVYDLTDMNKFTLCTSCNGSAIDAGLTPFSTISIPAGTGLSENSKNTYWLSPDVAIVNNSFDKSMELLEIGRNKGGMVTVETANTESGVSRGLRFQSKQETLGKIAILTKMFLESILFYMEGYLVAEPDKRKMPVVNFPTYLNVKDEETMRLEAIEAPLADRPAAYLTWINEKYKGNIPYIRAWEIGLEVCPLIVMNESELQSAQAIYSDLYFYMKDVIISVLYKLLVKSPESEDEPILAQALEKIKATFKIISPEPEPIKLFDDQARKIKEPITA